MLRKVTRLDVEEGDVFAQVAKRSESMVRRAEADARLDRRPERAQWRGLRHRTARDAVQRPPSSGAGAATLRAREGLRTVKVSNEGEEATNRASSSAYDWTRLLVTSSQL
eukprot:4078177-Pleurochrysis_carterae.AAC.1